MNALFASIEDPEKLIKQLSGKTKKYHAEEDILSQGDTLNSIAMVVKGDLHLITGGISIY